MTATVASCGRGRDFAGWNRASHAVLEAIDSRVARPLRRSGRPVAALRPLRDVVDRTAGPREHEAMELVRAHIARVVTGP